MYLQKLSVLNFKNYAEATLDLSSRINVFVGKNGSGKTNLLDAIHYLSLTKSAFSSTESQCIRSGEQFFMLKGVFIKQEGAFEILTSTQVGAKKIFRENQQDYEKLSSHIGKYPVVMIAPDDSELIKEGSEVRRKFFDALISQLDQSYLEALMQYNYALRQRNSLLKMFQDAGRVDALALDAYDRILIQSGEYVHQQRKYYLDLFYPPFHKFYSFLVGDKESATVRYVSGLMDYTFEEGLKKSRQKDLILQRTSFGIHRDDFLFELQKEELKRFGSQGQQKSFIIALKLAQFELFDTFKGFKPLLLLDDIFDKLDDFRIEKLLELIKESFGQLFITDARPDRTADLLKKIGVSATLYVIEQGTLSGQETI